MNSMTRVIDTSVVQNAHALLRGRRSIRYYRSCLVRSHAYHSAINVWNDKQGAKIAAAPNCVPLIGTAFYSYY
jgi:hypothetical protein